MSFHPAAEVGVTAATGAVPRRRAFGWLRGLPADSLEWRLQVGLGIMLTLLISTAWALGHEALHRSTDAYVLTRLQHDAEALLVRLAQTAPERLAQAGDGMLPVYSQPYSGHYFELLSDAQAIRSGSLGDHDLGLRALLPGEVERRHASGPNGQPLLMRVAGYSLDGRALTLAVAEDLTHSLATLKGFERMIAALAVLGLVLTLLVQRWILRSAFRRLRPVYRDIEALEHGTTTHLTEQVPAEILPLVRKLNGLLGVYDQRLTRSRNAAGNLAHALKGPLNLMVQQIDRAKGGLDVETHRLCASQVERVRELIERELKRARIAGTGRPGSVFDPHAELPALGDLLKCIYPDQALTLDWRIRVAGPLAIDREDMLELVGTLLDNACKWARTQVHCVLEPDGDGVRLRIGDDGPGCDDAALQRIGARGTRLDERVDGHGLGLSIAREIVDAYGGRIDFGSAPDLGGFSVSVALPIRAGAWAARPLGGHD